MHIFIHIHIYIYIYIHTWIVSSSSLEEEEDWKIGTADADSCELEGCGACLCPDARLHRCKNKECDRRCTILSA